MRDREGACTSGSVEPSHVLSAMGLSNARLKSALRLTLGRGTTEGEIDRTVEIVAVIAERLGGVGIEAIR